MSVRKRWLLSFEYFVISEGDAFGGKERLRLNGVNLMYVGSVTMSPSASVDDDDDDDDDDDEIFSYDLVIKEMDDLRSP